MIRATRIWGGTGFQGRAFGWLEGGRGAIAALLGSMALLLFSQIGEFTWVILASSILTFLADRFSRVHVIVVSFGLTLWGGLMIGLGLLDSILGLVLMNLTLTAAGIYGVRALYFAVLEEAGVPLALTGIAVGIVSFAGFTPEIFVSPLMGYLLDRNPGTVGHQHVFLLLVIFAGVGLGTSLIFNIFTNKHKSEAQNENEDSE